MSTLPFCKICGVRAVPFGQADFHANAKMHFGYYDIDIEPSGLLLDYVRCPQCGFMFTDHMDNWDAEKFAAMIYNKDYPQIDGTYNGYRAGTYANIFALAFHGFLNQLEFLDYGGGLGIQAALLRAFGARRSETYDPFASTHERPTGNFHLVSCTEVLEHSTDPKKSVADLVSFMNPETGLIFITTEMQPPDIEKQGCNWWYVSPRVGHVSLYSFNALERLFAPYGLKLAHVETHTHIAYREWPAWARHLLPPHYRPA